MVGSNWVCHWEKTFWVGGCDGIGGLAYLLFCAAYWSRQPRVFRRLSRSCIVCHYWDTNFQSIPWMAGVVGSSCFSLIYDSSFRFVTRHPMSWRPSSSDGCLDLNTTWQIKTTQPPFDLKPLPCARAQSKLKSITIRRYPSIHTWQVLAAWWFSDQRKASEFSGPCKRSKMYWTLHFWVELFNLAW